MLSLVVGAAHAQERARLVGIRAQGDEAASVIAVLGDRPLEFTTQKLSGPPRIVVDFAETEIPTGPDAMQVDDGTIRRVAATAVRPRTARVIIELAADAEFEVLAAGTQVEVRVPRIKPAVARAADEPPAVAVPGPPEGSLPAEKRAAAAKANIEKFSAAQKAREEKRAADEKSLVAKRAFDERKLAEQRAAADRKLIEERAATDRKLAEERASADRKLAARRAAEDKKLAADRVSSDKALAAARAREKAAAEREAARLAEQAAAADKAAIAARAAAQAEAERKAERAAQVAAIERERERVGQVAAPHSRKVAWAASSQRAITGIGFRPQGGGEVIVRSDRPLEYDVSGEPHAVLLHLPSAGIPRSNDRWPLDTSFFKGAVQRVVPLPVPGGTDLRIELRAHAAYQLAQNGSVLTVTFARP